MSDFPTPRRSIVRRMDAGRAAFADGDIQLADDGIGAPSRDVESDGLFTDQRHGVPEGKLETTGTYLLVRNLNVLCFLSGHQTPT